MDKSSTTESKLVFRNALDAPFTLHGTTEEGYLRMPESRAAAVSEGVSDLMRCASGLRVRFSTDSPEIAIRCRLGKPCRLNIMPLLGSAGFDLYRESGGGEVFLRPFFPPEDLETGYEFTIETGEGPLRSYTIHLPLYTEVKELYIGVAEQAVISKGAAYRSLPPVVFYGSSITMGGCASRPGNSYTAILSRMLDIDFYNLGFSGNAKGEPEMAEYLAGIDMSALVLDYDHNAPTVEHLRDTYLPFFSLLRRRKPDLPVIMVSRPDFEANPPDSVKRREIIRAAYDIALAGGDSRVWFCDGETLFGTDCRTDCTVDGVHPNDLGFYRMAKTLAPTLKQALGL